MSGLLVKDYRLLIQRKRSLLFIIFFSILMSLSIEGPFLIGYFVILGVTYASSTISYDEFDNGYPFLMTLPIDRKGYVLEKYVFSGIVGVSCWLFSSVIYLIMLSVRGTEIVFEDELANSIAFLPLLILFISITIPFMIRFGAEKGRNAMILSMGAFFAIFFLAKRGLKQSPEKFEKIVTFFLELSESTIILGIVVISAAILAVSYGASQRAMRKKEL